MIIQNGTIVFLSVFGAGMNPKTGHPQKGTEIEASEAIPCQWSASSLNLRGKSTGEPVVKARYSILIESYNVAPTERLALYRSDGSEVGRFSIISIEPLDAVLQTRIIV